MTEAEAIRGAKLRANLPLEETQFDAELGEFARDGVKRLYPIVQKQLTEDTTTTLAIDTDKFTLPTGILSVRSGGLFLQASGSSDYLMYDEFTQHGLVIYLREFDVAHTVKILGLGRYELDDLPEEYDVAVVYFMLSEFFSLLAGNKSKYNIYIQASGARGVDNMRELSDWYAEKANQEIADRATIEGA